MFGSRLAVRLVLLFALVAVLPGALVYAVSVQFLGRSIESWFDVRVDRALEGGLDSAGARSTTLLKDTANKATQIGDALADNPRQPSSIALTRAAEQAGAYEAALFSPTGSVLAVARHRPVDAPRRSRRRAQALRRARLQQTTSKIDAAPRRRTAAARRRAGEQRATASIR